MNADTLPNCRLEETGIYNNQVAVNFRAIERSLALWKA